jgi:hypoxanthine phosphoribosyltransferase
MAVCQNEAVPAINTDLEPHLPAGATGWGVDRRGKERPGVRSRGAVVGGVSGADRGADGKVGTKAEPRVRPIHQAALPSLGQLVRSARDPDFAHPAEVDLAQLLTFYGVRWAYEPTTFALSRAGENRPPEFFTPDFYLPEHRLYIELTTMRQRLVTRKNRKLRRLREQYPSVNIKLLYRRDYQRLVNAYDDPARHRGPGQLDQILCSEAAIADRVRQLAGEIAVDWPKGPGRAPLLLGVGRGSERFLTALTTALQACGVEVDPDRVELSRFNPAGRERRARIERAPRGELAGRRVLVVEDVVSTGLSLAFLVGWLRRQGAREVAACTLLNRAEARLVGVPVRHVGFNVSASVLAGFGLSLRPDFSDLPYIASVLPG